MDGMIDLKMVLSVFSFLVTTWFWLVKSRKERPNLEFHQLSNFRATCRRQPDLEGMKRLCIQQLDTGGVLIVNHSTRQNSIVVFECFLKVGIGEIRGDWGYTGNDRPPWNIGPESSIAFSPACFFDVPEDFQIPENPEFRIRFLTASGKSFTHRFARQAPRLIEPSQVDRQAA